MIYASIPGSTYRLQIHGGFTFHQARSLIPYLKELGITHVYSSPIFQAAPGSNHGYDIVDYNRINEESGGEEAFYEFAKELKSQGLGLILDFVPNHMGIQSPYNAWWYDVLENGSASRFSPYFDIDWDPVKRELKDRVMLPILGDSYGDVLERGDINLIFDEGSFKIQYFEHTLPVRPGTYPFILEYGLDTNAQNEDLDEEQIELLSILTAIRNLPSFTTHDPDEIAELAREKEVIKRRLNSLYQNHGYFYDLLEQNLLAFNGKRGNEDSFDLLDNLLSEQAYRLCYWGVATEEINYRRFFDINSLGAIRMEDPEIFIETHRLLGQLIAEGVVDGLRIDHPDGLYNPSQYFQFVQRMCYRAVTDGKENLFGTHTNLDSSFESAMQENINYLAFYVVGEKILEEDEVMPDDWPISGTTGYRFLNTVNGIFIRKENKREFDEMYSQFASGPDNYGNLVIKKKRLVLRSSMSSEINTLGHYLDRISEKDRHTRDFTLNILTRALAEVIACFPVYRTYIDSFTVRERDRKYIKMAIAMAIKSNPEINPSVFSFLRDVLLLHIPERLSESDKKELLHFVMRFQQITGPVMAKGLEDTTFYVYNRFVSLNEVGGNPGRFGLPVEVFHERNLERKHLFPHSMNSSSTHDTKRSEDVRARLNVLSEIPWAWREVVYRWSFYNRNFRYTIDDTPAPSANDEYLIYQSLVGAWPMEESGDIMNSWRIRLKDYIIKASREAKENSSWLSPSVEYEQALGDFIDSLLNSGTVNRFLNDLRPFVNKIIHWGMFNSLSMTALKLLSPGMPDFYQGTELWDFSFVDPDNRRPVNFNIRDNYLTELSNNNPDLHKLLGNRKDGRIKMYLIKALLKLRSVCRNVFDDGDYIPLYATGPARSNVVSFVRRNGDQEVILIAPRFFTEIIKDPTQEYPEMEWGSTVLNFRPAGRKYRNIFTGKVLGPEDSRGTRGLLLDECMDGFPVAVLIRD